MEEELELRDLLRIVLKRFWMIAGLFVIAVLIAGYISWFRLTPVYEASATIMIEARNSNPLESAFSALGTGTGRNDLNNSVEILKSRTLFEKVVERCGLDIEASSNEFASLRNSVFIQPVAGTDMIRVKVQDEDPERAQTIANTVVEVFEEQNRLTNQKATHSAKEFLETQIEVVKADLDEAEEALLSFQLDEGVYTVSRETEEQVKALAELDKQRAGIELALEDAEARLAELENQYMSEEKTVISATTLVESPEIQMYRKQLAELEVSLSSARERYTDAHPTVIALMAEIEATKRRLDREIGQVIGTQTQTTNPVAQGLLTQMIQIKAEMYGLEAEASALDQMIQVRETRLQSLPRKELDLARLMRNQQVKSEIYLMLLTKYEETRITEALSIGDVQLVDPALLPRSPIRPNKTMNVALAGFLAIFVGVGLAFLLEYLNTSLRSPEEVERVLGLPLVGQIPKIGLYETRGSGPRSGRRRVPRRKPKLPAAAKAMREEAAVSIRRRV